MSCECCGVDENANENNKVHQISSEIQNTGRPYKTIEAIINNNRMTLRIQKLVMDETTTWVPSCDCFPNSSANASETKYLDAQLSQTMMSSQVPKYLSTSSPFPHPRNKQPNMFNANEIIENPNIFLLKIRKRSETWDRKKENIDLEFRAPRPWPMPLPKKMRKIEKVSLENKQSEVFEAFREPVRPEEKPKKKKKQKGKRGKKKKK